MALDKNSTNVFYLTGRFIALIERSNGKRLSPSQIDNIFMHPSISIPQYDLNKLRFDSDREEILCKMPASGFPKRLNPEEASTVWIGYHHQRAVMPVETIVSEHEPKKIISFSENNIEELKK